MRRSLLCALLLWAVSRPVSAQSVTVTKTWGNNWCQTCYVTSHIDFWWPTTIKGWGFECGSGEPVTRADVYVTTPEAGQYRVTDAVFQPFLQRPDVRAYFARACPNVRGATGWHLVFPTPIPPDATSISVVLWKGSIGETHTLTMPR